MKVEVLRKNLADAIGRGCQMAGKSKTIPALDYTKVVFEGLNVTVESSSMEIHIRHIEEVLESEVERTEFYLNGSDFYSVLKSLRCDKVELNIEEGRITVCYERGHQTLPTTTKVNFPEFRPKGDRLWYAVVPHIFLDATIYASTFVSNDPMRPVMCCVRVEASDGECRVVGTNGQAVYVRYIDYKELRGVEEGKEASVNIPFAAASFLAKNLPAVEDTTISCYDKCVVVYSGRTYVRANLVEGRYVNWKAVVPPIGEPNFSVNRKEFIDVISRVGISASSVSQLVRLSCDALGVTVSCEDIDFAKSAKESIVPLAGESAMDPVGLNYTLIMRMLHSLPNVEVSVYSTSPGRPVIFKGMGEEKGFCLVAPIVLDK